MKTALIPLLVGLAEPRLCWVQKERGSVGAR